MDSIRSKSTFAPYPTFLTVKLFQKSAGKASAHRGHLSSATAIANASEDTLLLLLLHLQTGIFSRQQKRATGTLMSVRCPSDPISPNCRERVAESRHITWLCGGACVSARAQYLTYVQYSTYVPYLATLPSSRMWRARVRKTRVVCLTVPLLVDLFSVSRKVSLAAFR